MVHIVLTGYTTVGTIEGYIKPFYTGKSDRLTELEENLESITNQLSLLTHSVVNNTNKFERFGSAKELAGVAIDGPRMGKQDNYRCPKGSYVSSVQASKSIGGRYGVDGISELIIRCTNFFEPETK